MVDRAVTRRYRMAKELIDTVEALLTFHIKEPARERCLECRSPCCAAWHDYTWGEDWQRELRRQMGLGMALALDLYESPEQKILAYYRWEVQCIVKRVKAQKTMNELFSKLYKEAEKIKQWKLTVESELNQKERKFQENRKIIEAQKKAIQELQAKNEKLHLKLEDEICENKDLLKEAVASRHLCNLLKETFTHFTEKTSKYEQEKEATKQLYEELHCNVERMTVAFEELRVQAENNRLEMSFKLKEEAEKVDKFEKECKLEVSQKEKQISALTIQRDEKDDVIKDIKAQLQTSQNKIADLMEAKCKSSACCV
ncbi:synaptonemal complex protein 1-like [Passerculus sandwichensis]